MEIYPIFEDEKGNRTGIHSFRYSDGETEEFERMFSLWTDTKYIKNYLIANQKYLQSLFFSGITIDDLIDQILDEAEEMEKMLLNYCEKGFESENINLQTIFRPLSNFQDDLKELNSYKVSVREKLFNEIEHRKTKDAIIRIYAIKIEDNCFIITGGAIKLTQRMEDHPDTILELNKLKRCRDYLIENEIRIADDLIYYYEGNNK